MRACKIFFTLGTAVDIGGVLIPSFQQKIMDYGSRATSTTSSTRISIHRNARLSSLLDYIASYQVSHTWFTHYYLVSVVSSIFWGYQILTHGAAVDFFAFHSPPLSTGGMTINQVFIAWSFMTLQGIRRLFESLTITKSSQSKMWVGLWLLGIGYYIVMGISVWIEGIGEYSLLISEAS